MVNGTCNTNKLKMPLLIKVGITNFNKIFPLAYSYCLGEIIKSYDFFFETLREEIFFNDILNLTIIIRD
jgi:hypothetical protein